MGVVQRIENPRGAIWKIRQYRRRPMYFEEFLKAQTIAIHHINLGIAMLHNAKDAEMFLAHEKLREQ